MSGEELKALSRRAAELWSSENRTPPGDLVADGYRYHQEPSGVDANRNRKRMGWDWRAVLESYHEDFVAEGRQESGSMADTSTSDLQGWNDLLKSYHAAFSNSKVEILGQIAEDDMVATRWRIAASHTGSFAGTAATGNRVIWSGVTTDRLEDGRIVESWVNWDKFGFLRGMGLIK